VAAQAQPRLRVVQFSVQSDHLHLLVEAADERALSLGIRGLVVRLARAINRAMARRGPVWGDRYHTRPLTTPREVRNALVYVLMNFKKHTGRRTSALDPCSSAAWFDGFVDRPGPPPAGRAPVSRAQSWLAAAGWRRRGLIQPDEAPQAPPARSGRRRTRGAAAGAGG
jgi:hypothetical protein